MINMCKYIDILSFDYSEGGKSHHIHYGREAWVVKNTMSGPKGSNYGLITAAAILIAQDTANNIAEHERREQERRRAENEAYDLERMQRERELRELAEKIDNKRQELREKIEGYKSMTGLVHNKEFEKRCSIVFDKLKKITEIPFALTVEGNKNTLNRMQYESDALFMGLDNMHRRVRELEARQEKDEEEYEQIQVPDIELNDEVQEFVILPDIPAYEDIKELQRTRNERRNSDRREQEEQKQFGTFEKDYIVIVSETEQLINKDYLFADDKDALYKNFTELHKNIKSHSSTDILSACFERVKHQINRINDISNETIEKYSEYVSLIELINELEPGRECQCRVIDFKDISELCEAVDRLKNEYQQLYEESYVRKKIDEVMRKHGFNMSEKIVLEECENPAPGTGDYICKKIGDDVGVHMHVDSEHNSIMLEIVGTGDYTGPETDSNATGRIVEAKELSEERRRTLYEEQIAFCRMHPMIMDDLRKFGIVLTEKNYCHADVSFSKEIQYRSSIPSGNTASTAEAGRDRNDGRLQEMAVESE